MLQRYERKEVRNAYVFLLPIGAAVILFILVPVLGTLWNSFFRDVSFLPRRLVGVRNYIAILSEASFWQAAWFTIAFTVVAVALEACLGMAFAVLLSQQFPLRGVLRTVILVPWAIPTIVSAKVWKLVFQYTYGVLNYLVTTLGVSDAKINWLGSAAGAFWSIVIAEVWKTTPFVVIILLAGLQAIPEEVYKQAKIDGARMFKRFWTITLPLLRPVLVIALVFRTIDSLRIFDLVYVLTGGGPGGATTTLSVLGFEYFSNDRFGMGSAISIITFFLAFGFTLLYVKAGRFRESLR